MTRMKSLELENQTLHKGLHFVFKQHLNFCTLVGTAEQRDELMWHLLSDRNPPTSKVLLSSFMPEVQLFVQVKQCNTLCLHVSGGGDEGSPAEAGVQSGGSGEVSSTSSCPMCQGKSK